MKTITKLLFVMLAWCAGICYSPPIAAQEGDENSGNGEKTCFVQVTAHDIYLSAADYVTAESVSPLADIGCFNKVSDTVFEKNDVAVLPAFADWRQRRDEAWTDIKTRKLKLYKAPDLDDYRITEARDKLRC